MLLFLAFCPSLSHYSIVYCIIRRVGLLRCPLRITILYKERVIVAKIDTSVRPFSGKDEWGYIFGDMAGSFVNLDKKKTDKMYAEMAARREAKAE